MGVVHVDVHMLSCLKGVVILRGVQCAAVKGWGGGRRGGLRAMEQLPCEKPQDLEQQVHGGAPKVMADTWPQAKETPGELLNPRGRREASRQRRLEATMEPFHCPIGLHMVGRGMMMFDSQGGGEKRPEGRSELESLV